MSINKPSVNFSTEEKALLIFISEILLEYLDSQGGNSNLPEKHIALTDKQCIELKGLISKLLAHPKFDVVDLFFKLIHLNRFSGGERAKKIYMEGRSSLGKSTAMSSYQWDELRQRIGGLSWSDTLIVRTEPMSEAHFLKMETMLFNELYNEEKLIKQSVANYLSLQTLKRLGKLQKKRARRKNTQIKSVKYIFEKLNEAAQKQKMLTVENLEAAAFVLSNSSVLFTTRDWTATGVLSLMVGTSFNVLK